MIEPGEPAHAGTGAYVYLATNLDEAIWDAEIATGDGPAHIYIVEPTSDVEGERQKVGGSPVDVVPLAPTIASHGRGHRVASGKKLGVK